MKYPLILILSLLGTLSTFAVDASIVIMQKSGNKMVLDLSSNPSITFSGETMVITSNLTTITIPLADIDNYTVNDETAGIKPVTMEPQYTNGHVVFQGLAQGAEARVYTADGRLVSRHPADTSGHADVSLDSLPKGSYIIVTPNNKMKIINK